MPAATGVLEATPAPRGRREISEALGLQWRHVHLRGDRPHVKVRRQDYRGRVTAPKGYKRRDVPLDRALVEALERRRKEAESNRDEDLVFASLNGTALRYENVRRRALEPVAEEVGAPWAGFHTFRHTCASLLFERGANAVQVQRWLGHHSPAFTLSRYVHLLGDDLGQPLEFATELAVAERSGGGWERNGNRKGTIQAKTARRRLRLITHGCRRKPKTGQTVPNR